MFKKSKILFFSFLFLCTSLVAKVALPLRLLGFDKVLNDVTVAKNTLKDSISSVEFLFLMIQLFLFLITFFLASACIFGIYKELKIYRLKKLRMILGQLRLEMILKNSSVITQVNVKLFDLIENIVRKKYFLTITGKDGQLRFLETLEVLKLEKVNFEKEIELVDSLLKVIEGF